MKDTEQTASTNSVIEIQGFIVEIGRFHDLTWVVLRDGRRRTKTWFLAVIPCRSLFECRQCLREDGAEDRYALSFDVLFPRSMQSLDNGGITITLILERQSGPPGYRYDSDHRSTRVGLDDASEDSILILRLASVVTTCF